LPAEQPESPAQPDGETESEANQQDSSIDEFLDKLMMAESGGRLTAKNPRSSALGPYQFINSTFIEVVDRHFSDEVEGLNRAQILALRTDLDFSRRAATAFNSDNAAYLRQRGLPATFAHLRLSYLLGAPGAAQVLNAKPDTKLTKVLPAPVIRANPFMRRLTVAGLVDRAEREVGIGEWTISNEVAQAEADFSSSETREQETAAPPPASATGSKSKSSTNAQKTSSKRQPATRTKAASKSSKRDHRLQASTRAASKVRSVEVKSPNRESRGKSRVRSAEAKTSRR